MSSQAHAGAFLCLKKGCYNAAPSQWSCVWLSAQSASLHRRLALHYASRERGGLVSVISSHAWLEGCCIIRGGKTDGWGSRVVWCWAVWPRWPCYHYGWQGWPVQPLLQQAAVAFNGIICSSPCHPIYLSLTNSLSVSSSLWYLVSGSRAVESMPNLTGSLIKVRIQMVI